MKHLKPLWRILSMHAYSCSPRIMMTAILVLGLLYGGTDLMAQESGYSGNIDIGVHEEFSIDGKGGTLKGSITGGAKGNITVEDGALEIDGTIGLAAELEGVSEKFTAGNKDAGGSIQGSAKVEALLGAEAKVGASIDENGITIGLQARAGAFVSASAELNLEVHLFGLSAKARLYGEAHAGVMASAQAVVEIGFNGKIKFGLGAGVAAVLGASAGIEVEMDASGLMEKLGIPNLAALVGWLDKFVEDPVGTVLEAGMDLIIDEAAKIVEDVVIDIVEIADNFWTGWAGFWAGPGIPATPSPDLTSEVAREDQEPDSPAQDQEPVISTERPPHKLPDMFDNNQDLPGFNEDHLIEPETGSGEKWRLKEFPPEVKE